LIKQGTPLRTIQGMTEIVNNKQVLTDLGKQFQAGALNAQSQFSAMSGLTSITNAGGFKYYRPKPSTNKFKSFFNKMIPGQSNGGLYGGGSNMILSGTFDDPATVGSSTEASSGVELETVGESATSYSNGGFNSMLMGGEYVLSRQAAGRMGKSRLDSLNNLNAPMNFANGGAVMGGMSPTSNKADVENLEINININKDGSASSDVSGGGGEDPQKAKEFSKKIKEVVLNVINEEKRVSGTLFTRNK
jgi:hypothetical protein